MTQVQEAKQLMTQLIGKVNKLKEKNDIIQDNYNGLKETFMVLTDRYKEVKQDNEKLVIQLKQTEDSQKVAAENKQLRDEVDRLLVKVSELETESRKKPEVNVDELLNKISLLEAQLQERNEKISQLDSHNDELFNTIQELENRASKDITVNNESEDDKVWYRFGHTTPEIMHQVTLFVRALFDGINDHSAPYELMSVGYASKKVKIDEKTANVFVGRLCEMTIGDKHIFRMMDNGRLKTFFNRDAIINNITAIVKINAK